MILIGHWLSHDWFSLVNCFQVCILHYLWPMRINVYVFQPLFGKKGFYIITIAYPMGCNIDLCNFFSFKVFAKIVFFTFDTISQYPFERRCCLFYEKISLLTFEVINRPWKNQDCLRLVAWSSLSFMVKTSTWIFRSNFEHENGLQSKK